MAKRRWPDDVFSWLTNNVHGKMNKELTELINQQGFDKKYGMKFTVSGIIAAKKRYGLKSGLCTKFPKEMEQYIRSIATGRKSDEIAKMTAKHFGIKFTTAQCQAYKLNHGIGSEIDCRFKPRKVGAIRRKNEGYIEIKVAEPDVWKLLHRVNWEAAHGPIPDGKIVSFLDGDKGKCELDNLVLLDIAIHLEMNNKGLRFANKDLTAIGVNIAKLNVETYKRKRRGGVVND